MSRTYKDEPVAKKRRSQTLPFSKSYLRSLNPKRRCFDADESDSTLCPVCDSELSSTGNTHFCENCGWNNAQGLIDEMDFDEAA